MDEGRRWWLHPSRRILLVRLDLIKEERMRDSSQRGGSSRAQQAGMMVPWVSSFETGRLRRPASIKEGVKVEASRTGPVLQC